MVSTAKTAFRALLLSVFIGLAIRPSFAGGFAPDPKVRDRVFQQAGVMPVVQAMDAVDRDVLYLRASYLSQDILKSRYPNLKPEQLKALQDAVMKQEGDPLFANAAQKLPARTEGGRR